MPLKSRAEMLEAARYAPELSGPILNAIADVREGLPRHDVNHATIEAVRGAVSRSDLARLYGDLICALNGSDDLPFVAGLIWAAAAAAKE